MSELQLQIARLLDVQRYREAERLLARAFSEGRPDAMLHCLAARVALATERLDEAEQHVARALSFDARHYHARLLLHLCQREQKQYGAAEASIIELIRDYPDDAQLLALYAELMLRTLHLDKARALAEEALRREPDHRGGRFVQLLLSISEGRHADASEQLQAMIVEDPDNMGTLAALYLVLVERGRHAEAFEVGRELVRLRPDEPELVEGLAELRARLHWSTLPLYPMRRYGWAGSAAVWLGGTLAIRAVGRREPAIAAVLAGVFVLYVVYSWVYPPLLKRWLLHRGF